MKQQLHLFPVSTLLLVLVLVTFLHFCTTTLAQSPVQSPAPAAPTNITAILEKAGKFNVLIRLLQSTQVLSLINTQLNDSNQGLTLFAPPDSAFSSLKSGTLNSLSDQQKVELVQFHLLPSYVPLSQFQTVSNPLRTQAGNADSDPLNVTTVGTQVNISTGVNDSGVDSTVYTDGQLAVYEVDKVLLPMDLFGAPPPALAPKPEKGSPPSDSPDSSASTVSTDSSGAIGLTQHAMLSFTVAAIIAAIFFVITNS